MSQISPVLVVNPYVTDFKLYDEWMHPLGLYMLIDLLKANNIPVHYCNCLERDPEETVKKYGTGKFTSREIDRPALYDVLKRKYKCYGCSVEQFRSFLATVPKPSTIFVGSMMTYWAEGVIMTISLLQEIFPAVPIVCGGIAVQLMPEYFKKNIPGVHLFTGALPSPGKSVEFPGVDSPLKAPEVYSLLAGMEKKTQRLHGPLLSSVGCPMGCSYCASKVLQPTFVKRPMEIVTNELREMVERFGITDFACFDDALLADADNLLVPILDYCLKNRLHIRLHTPNGLHLKYVTEPLLLKMKSAGFTTLRFGYESGVTRNRHLTGKKADAHLLQEKLALVQRYQFPDTGVYVMGGLPNCTPNELMEEMRFIADAGALVKPVFLSPVPKTDLFAHYLSQYPQIAVDPLWHNDHFFITCLPGWNSDTVEQIRLLARELNRNNR